MKAPVARHLAASFAGAEPPVLVTSNYQVGAGLEFVMRPPDGVYVLRHKLNADNGYDRQLAIWGLDEAGLRRDRAGREALILIDDRPYWFQIGREARFRRRLCAIFDNLSFLESFEYPAGRKHLMIYKGRVRAPDAPPPAAATPASCAALASVYLPRPKRGFTRKGIVRLSGWAIDEASGIARVEVLVDGKVIGEASYGHHHGGLTRRFPGVRDPNIPRVGFRYRWDTTTLPDGPHRLAIRAIAKNGTVHDLPARTVFIKNR